MFVPSLSEIAIEALKSAGEAAVSKIKKIMEIDYVGDTYYDNPTPNSIFFNTDYDIRIERLQEDQMKNRNFYPDLEKIKNIGKFSSDENELYNSLVEELKSYAKKIEKYDYEKSEVRTFNNVDNIVTDIRKYVSDNHYAIRVNDDPDGAYFGYECKITGVKWRIDSEYVLDYFSDPENPPDILDVYYLNTGDKASGLDKEVMKPMIEKILHTHKNENNHLELIVDEKAEEAYKKYAEKVLNDFDKLPEVIRDNKLSWTYWENPIEMFEDISQHAKDNGRAIISNDLPTRLSIGYVCTNTGKSWAIKIRDLRNHWEELQNSNNEKKKYKGQLLQQAFSTLEGKKNLLSLLNTKYETTNKGINPLFLFAGAMLGGLITAATKEQPQVRVIDHTSSQDTEIENERQEEQNG